MEPKKSAEDLKILVGYHRPFLKPPESEIFLPIQGGKKLGIVNLGMQGDDSGDNISEKQPSFGPYTVLYWAWKNIKFLYPNLKYIGFFHYRRYMALDTEQNIEKNNTHFGRRIKFVNKIPDMKDCACTIREALDAWDILLIDEVKMPYSIKTGYEVCHNWKYWILFKTIVKEMAPDYIGLFEKDLEENNIGIESSLFITRWKIFDAFCKWMFPLLFELEKQIKAGGYDPEDRDVAFIGEWLMGLFIEKNNLKSRYYPYYWVDPGMRIRTIVRFIESFVPVGFINLYRKIKMKGGRIL